LLLTLTDPSRPVITNDPIQDVLNDNNAITTTAVVTPIVETSSVAVAPVRTTATSTTVINNQVPTDTMIVRVNPLLNPQLAASQVSKQYSYDGLTAVNFSAANNGGGNVSVA
ncbi:hypothetical protein, partial [Pseudomonas sp. HY7a-MNA-CIBAN-0227]